MCYLFANGQDLTTPAQQQRLARILKICMWKEQLLYFSKNEQPMRSYTLKGHLELHNNTRTNRQQTMK